MSFIISSSNIQPWGNLHNDFIYPIDDYQSISHILYASILPQHLQKNLKKLTNVDKMKKVTEIVYKDYLEDISKEAIQDSLEVLLENKSLLNLLNSLPDTIKSSSSEINNTIATVLMFVKKPNTNKSQVELPLIFQATTTHVIYLNDLQFNSILEVVYFYFYKFFTQSKSQAYTIIKSCKHDFECLEQQFQNLQKSYFTQKITDAASKYIPLKFENMNLLKLLNTVPKSYIQLQDNGFLKQIINPISSSWLNNLKRLSPRYELLNINDLVEEEKDIAYWIKYVRCKDLKHTFTLLENYTKLTLSNSQVKLCIDMFYGTCRFSSLNNVLVDSFPEYFKEWMLEDKVESLTSEYSLYSCWKYLSKLIYICTYIKSIDETWEYFFDKYQLNVKYIALTKENYYKMIDHLLSYLQTLNQNLLRVTNYGELEFNFIQDLLRINKLKYRRDKILPELNLTELRPSRKYKTTYFQIYGNKQFEFPENKTVLDILRSNELTNDNDDSQAVAIENIWELALINKYKIKNPKFIYNIGNLVSYLDKHELNLPQKSKCFYYS